MIKKSLMGVAAAGLIVSTQSHDHRAYLISELDAGAVQNILEKAENVRTSFLPFQSLTLVLDSPGGLADGMNVILRELERSDIKFNTQIEYMAASAAAVLFTKGEKRVMIKDSEILFHRVRIMVGMFGTIVLTAHDIATYVNTGKMPVDFEGDAQSAIDFLNGVDRKVIVDVLASLLKTDDNLIKTVAKNLGMTEEEVVKNLLPVGKDVILTAEEALKLGVATEIKEI